MYRKCPFQFTRGWDVFCCGRGFSFFGEITFLRLWETLHAVTLAKKKRLIVQYNMENPVMSSPLILNFSKDCKNRLTYSSFVEASSLNTCALGRYDQYFERNI